MFVAVALLLGLLPCPHAAEQHAHDQNSGLCESVSHEHECHCQTCDECPELQPASFETAKPLTTHRMLPVTHAIPSVSHRIIQCCPCPSITRARSGPLQALQTIQLLI